MNQPDRYERFVIPEGKRKAEYERDQKHENTGVYIIQREDHTVGNLLRMKLHEDDSVVFAGYRIPHPLDPVMHVRIQTNGSKAPEDAMKEALTDLRTEITDLKNKLHAQIMQKDPHPRSRASHEQQQQQPGGYAHYQQQPVMTGYQYGGHSDYMQ
jgi:DNA-directed RNA polymerase II subunit RPB11